MNIPTATIYVKWSMRQAIVRLLPSRAVAAVLSAKRLPNKCRLNIKIFDQTHGGMVEINGNGGTQQLSAAI